ncbi:MAG TPA: VOC family protein [Actinomycetota bacterium]|nr:VOC family protein [Actinomycetota bacterium]
MASARPQETRSFYETLGLEVGMDMGWIATLVSPSNPTAQISVVEGDDPEPQLTVEVDDVDAVYERAREGDAPIVRQIRDEDWGVRRFFVRDPNGLVVNVMGHLGRA